MVNAGRFESEEALHRYLLEPFPWLLMACVCPILSQSAAAHGFVTGDIVRAGLASTEDQTWLTHGGEYVVTVLSTTQFTLSTFDANGTETKVINHGAADNTAAMTFTKIEKGLKIQTLDRDENLKGTAVTLFDKDILATRTPAAPNSVRLTGQVMFESPNVFTVAPQSDAKILFRDAPESASLRKISDMDVLTVRNAQRMMSAVDGALRKVDAERGDLGATMNRMEHTIDNLSNIRFAFVFSNTLENQFDENLIDPIGFGLDDFRLISDCEFELPDDYTVCSGETTTINADTTWYRTFAWSTGSFADSISLVVNQDTTIYISATNEFCSVQDSITIFVQNERKF